MLSNRSANGSNGTMFDFYIAGMVGYGTMVMLANIKMLIISKTFSVFTLFFIIGSWLLYPIIYLIYNK